jgi:Bacterial regulatory proteins, lacI family
MPTIIEIAEHAEVPVWGVLRVLNGDSVSGETERRVRDAVEELGAPHQGIVESLNVLNPRPVALKGEIVESEPSSDSRGRALERRADDEIVERAREGLLEAFARAVSEFEETVPQGVSTVVYEALRVEVAPVAQRVSHIDSLVDQLAAVIRELGDYAIAERRERLDDVKLLVDLIVSGWQGVDRRLGRIERMLERMQPAASQLPPRQF